MADLTADMAYIMTYTGKAFHLLDPQPEEIDLFDIAWALSHVCRFTGHLHVPYYVAQHCVLVSRACHPDWALQGLLHDASEAYIADVARPVKHLDLMAGYRELEARIQRAVYRKFDLPEDEHPSVKLADTRVLFTEKRDLLPAHITWGWTMRPLPTKIVAWSPAVARRAFMARFLELTHGKPTQGEEIPATTEKAGAPRA